MASIDLSSHRAALRALMRRSDLRGLGQFATHAGMLAATAALVTATRGTAGFAPALLLHGVVLVFLFAALHETIHRTAFAHRWLNDTVAWLCGALLVLPPVYFRAFHLVHHRYTQRPGRDPELATPKPATLRGYLWYLSGLPYWGERIRTTLRHARGRVREPFIARQRRSEIVAEARGLVAVYAVAAMVSLALHSEAAIWYWLVPALLGQPVLRAFLLAEHWGCPQIPDMLRNSRTTCSIRALRRLAWNMPYHAEHHLAPGLPFHALPKAQGLLKDQVAVQARGYLAVHGEILVGLWRRSAATRAGSHHA